MANNNAPFGFREFGRQEGGSPTAGMERFTINSSDTNLYFTGDPVAQTGGVLTPYVGSSASLPLLGIFAGCEYYNPQVNRVTWSPYFPGSVGGNSSTGAVTAYVIADEERLFIVQGSTTAITAASVGLNANIVTSLSSTGNTATGISAVTLASTQISNSSSFPWKIVDLYSNLAPPGVPGTDNSNNFNIVVVTPNQSARHAGVASS